MPIWLGQTFPPKDKTMHYDHNQHRGGSGGFLTGWIAEVVDSVSVSLETLHRAQFDAPWNEDRTRTHDRIDRR